MGIKCTQGIWLITIKIDYVATCIIVHNRYTACIAIYIYPTNDNYIPLLGTR